MFVLNTPDQADILNYETMFSLKEQISFLDSRKSMTQKVS